MPQKICKHCGESFTLFLGKPGYANECPACLHEKTRPNLPPDFIAQFLRRNPEKRRHLNALRKSLGKLGLNASQVEEVIADSILRAPATQE